MLPPALCNEILGSAVLSKFNLAVFWSVLPIVTSPEVLILKVLVKEVEPCLIRKWSSVPLIPAAHLLELEEFTNDKEIIWIDMESGIRSNINRRDSFDINKAFKCILKAKNIS